MKITTYRDYLWAERQVAEASTTALLVGVDLVAKGVPFPDHRTYLHYLRSFIDTTRNDIGTYQDKVVAEEQAAGDRVVLDPSPVPGSAGVQVEPVQATEPEHLSYDRAKELYEDPQQRLILEFAGYERYRFSYGGATRTIRVQVIYGGTHEMIYRYEAVPVIYQPPLTLAELRKEFTCITITEIATGKVWREEKDPWDHWEGYIPDLIRDPEQASKEQEV